MTPLVQTITILLSVGIILGQLYALALIAGLLFKKYTWGIMRLTSDYVLEFGFLVSGLGVVFSLFYSQVAGFAPCTMCWWQRIFLYPQVVIFIVALYYRRTRGLSDKVATTSSLLLSIIGALLAAYQYYAQMFDPSILSTCTITGASCTKLFFVSFGYITLPFMSLVSFILLILFIVTHKVMYWTND